MAQAKTKTHNQLKADIAQLMADNRREKNGHIYTIPSRDTYPYQWLWDSCFHAIILSHIDPEIAKAELSSLASAQFKNGMIPHMIYWQRGDEITPFPVIKWGKRRTSSITQPPMLAIATWQVYQACGDKSFLRDMLPVIRRFHGYLRRQRDPRKSGLIGVVNPDESGEDNSPRYDQALHLDPHHDFQSNFKKRLRLVKNYKDARFMVKQHMDRKHWVRDVPMNSIFVASSRAAAQIAGELDNTLQQKRFTKHAEQTAAGMRLHMLEHDLFWSTMGYNQKKICVRTWALFAPLFAQVATPQEAEALRRIFYDEKTFATKYRIPSTSIDEPAFDPSGDWRGESWVGTNWRGPVWIGANWIMAKGLEKYGMDKERDILVRDSLRLIKKSGFREYYDPLTGKGHGARNFTWGGLLLDLL